MKGKAFLAVALFIAVAFCGVYAMNEDADESSALTDGDWTFTVNDDGITATLTQFNTTGSGTVSELRVPYTVSDGTTTYTVTAMQGSLMYAVVPVTELAQNCTLILPSSLSVIGDYAFNGCDRFTGSLVIPNSVTSIGDYAFGRCYGFTGSLTIPDSVTSIGEYAFGNCYGFTGSLTIGDSVTDIGPFAFNLCDGFTGSLTIPDSVTSIGTSAFGSCRGFTGSLTIGDSMTSIGERAFYNCWGLTGSLTIPDSVTSIGEYAFYNCRGFTGSLTIGDSMTSFGNSAFEGCYRLTGSLTIPDSVTSIGNSAFRGCYGFTGSLTIPDSVITIGNMAFESCHGFTGSLTIPDSVTSIGTSAFGSCRGFTGSLTIPDSVTSIGTSAFRDCSGFTGSLTISNSITSLNDNVFRGCRFTGVLEIPYGVTTIGKSAFYACINFTTVIIPETVSSIYTSSTQNENSFYNCANIRTVYDATDLNIQQDIYNGYAGYYATTIYRCHTITITPYESSWGEVTKPHLIIVDGESILVSGDTISTSVPNQTSTAVPNPTYSFMDFMYDSGPIYSDTYVTANFRTATYYNVYFDTYPSGGEYGTVSEISISVMENTSITESGDTLIIGPYTVTASPNPQSSGYTYSFAYWSNVPSTVMSDTYITANFEATVRYYDVTIQSNDTTMGQVSESHVSVPYNTSYSASMETMYIGEYSVYATVEPESTEWTYSFQSWSPANGTIIDNSTIITANFVSTPREYYVYFSSNDSEYGTVSENQITARYGDSISVSGSSITIGSNPAVNANPTQSTSVDTYTFDYWDWSPSGNTIIGETWVTAHFSHTVVYKRVTIESNNLSYGTVSISGEGSGYVDVPYGTSYYSSNNTLYIGNYEAIATAEPDSYDYDYSFTGWSSSSGTVTENMTIYANFTSTPIIRWVVTFSVNVSEYGSVSPSSLTVRDGSSISVSGSTITIGSDSATATPTSATDEYRYYFGYWSHTSGTVHSDMTITATFTRTIQKYTVTFIENVDSYGYVTQTGSIIHSVSVEYGSTISTPNEYSISFSRTTTVTVEAHTLMDTNQWDYSFDGWSPDSGTVTGNMNIQVTFSRTLQEHTVTFEPYESTYGSVSIPDISVPYGTTYAVNQNGELEIYGSTVTAQATQADETYYYTFREWSPSSGTVTGPTTIQAIFDRDYVPYTVNFVVNPSGNGTLNIQSTTVHYNTSFTTNGNELVIGSETVIASPSPTTAEHSYVFDHWSDASGYITTSPVTITAYIREVPVLYRVDIYSNNTDYGQVSRDWVEVEYNTPYSVNGNTLTIGTYTITADVEIDTAQYDYEFESWDVSSGYVISNMDIHATFSATLIWYDVTFSVTPNGYGSVSESILNVPYGTTISSGANPNEIVVGSTTVTATHEPNTAQYTYTFTEWTGVSSAVHGDMSIVAHFNRTTNQYLVHFDVNDSEYGHIDSTSSAYWVFYGTTFSVSGSQITFGGHTVRAVASSATNEYVYSFSSWSGVPSSVTEETYITANFDRDIRLYTVTIYSSDTDAGTVSRRFVEVPYNTSYSSSDTTMTIGSETVTATVTADTAQYDYEFVGWSPSSGTVTDNSTVITARFTTSVATYTVTFAVNNSEWGSVSVPSVTVPYGTTFTSSLSLKAMFFTSSGSETIPDVIATPTEDTHYYDYEFAGWSPSSGTVSDNMTVTVNFTRTLIEFTVRFVPNDSSWGSVDVNSLTVLYGTTVSANDNVLTINGTTVTATPTSDTIQYDYGFQSWSMTSGEITEDTTITATFTRDVKTYQVTITSSNPSWGTVDTNTLYVDYGTAVSVNDNLLFVGSNTVTATPHAESLQYRYVFDEWSMTSGEIVGNTAISASFERITIGYVVSFTSSNSEWGTVNVNSVTVPYDTPYTVSSNQITINGTTVTATSHADTAQYDYFFVGWSENSGTVTEDMTITANFDRNVIAYVVTITNTTPGWGSVDTNSVTVDYGTTVSADANILRIGMTDITATPTMSTMQYQYDFGSWSMTSGEITGNTNINVTFTRTTLAYVVTITTNGLGTVNVQQVTVDYGTAITSSGNTVTIGETVVTATPAQDTVQYHYEFDSWNIPNESVTDDMTITARFTQSVINYRVTINSSNPLWGSVSESSLLVPYGTVVSSNMDTLTVGTDTVLATPTEDTAQYTYGFDYWENGTGEITDNTTITAHFTRTVNNYTVTITVGTVGWGDVDEDEVYVPYGTVITAEGNVLSVGETDVTATPTQDDEQYDYGFDRWSVMDSETVVGDTEVIVYFSRTTVSYTVTFTVGNPGWGTVDTNSVTVPYGTYFSTYENTLDIDGNHVTATPTQDTAQYDYEFDRWSENSGSIIGTTTITAYFTRSVIAYNVYIVKNDDFGTIDETVLTVDYGTRMSASGNVLTVGATDVTAQAYDSNAQYTYGFSGWLGVVPSVVSDVTVTAQFTRTINQYTVTIQTSNDYGTVSPNSVTVDYGTYMNVSDNILTIGENTVTATPIADTSQFEYSFVEWMDTSSSVLEDMTVVAVFQRTLVRYDVTIQANDSEWGRVSQNVVRVEFGTSISVASNVLYIGTTEVTATPVTDSMVYHYEFVGWSNIPQSNIVVEDITITADFSRTLVEYTVTVRSNNTEYGTVSLGEVTAYYGTPISIDSNILNVGGTQSVAIETEDTAQYTYTFVRWEGFVPSVVDDCTITANFTRSLNYYTVSFIVDEGRGTWSVEEISAGYGTSVTLDGLTVIVGDSESTLTVTPDTDTKAYVLDSLSVPVSTVVSDVDVTANISEYNQTPAFNIIQPKYGEYEVSGGEGSIWALVLIIPTLTIVGLIVVIVRQTRTREDDDY